MASYGPEDTRGGCPDTLGNTEFWNGSVTYMVPTQKGVVIMRRSLGIAGVVLYFLFGFLRYYLNNPLWRGVLFMLSIIPVTLIAFLFVDTLKELKETKKFASFVTFLMVLVVIGSLCHRTASSTAIVGLVLFVVFAWVIALFIPK